MRRLLVSAALLAALACVACGSVSTEIDAAPQDDAAPTIDADTSTPDAGVDGGTPAGRSGNDLTSGGLRVSGGAFTVDVQIGHPFAQGPASGGGTTIEGGAAIKP